MLSWAQRIKTARTVLCSTAQAVDWLVTAPKTPKNANLVPSGGRLDNAARRYTFGTPTSFPLHAIEHVLGTPRAARRGTQRRQTHSRGCRQYPHLAQRAALCRVCPPGGRAHCCREVEGAG